MEKKLSLPGAEGVDYESTPNDEVSMKFWALQQGFPVYFKAMHQSERLEKILKESVDDYGNTIAHLAAECGNVEAFKTIFPLDHSPCFEMLTTENSHKRTPLHVAIERGHMRILKVLQETRAERKQRVAKGNDVDEKRKENREEEQWNNFWREECPKLLLFSCIYGTVEVVKYFVCNTSTSNMSWRGHTPLSCAAKAGHHEIVTYLLGVKGISPDGGKDDEGNIVHSPLLLAAKHGHTKCVTLLLKNGADITVKSDRGYNYLMEAIQGKHQETAIAILSHDKWKEALRVCCQLNKEEKHYMTPMRMLTEMMPDVAEMVLNKCITIKKVSEENTTTEMVHYTYEFIEDHCEKGQEKEEEELHAPNRISFQLEAEMEAEMETEMGAEMEEEEQMADNDGNMWWLRSCDEITEPTTNDEVHSSKWGPKRYFSGYHPLALMVKHHRLKLLQHPLIYHYIQRKWWRAALPLFLVYMFFYVLFLVLLTSFALTSPRPGPDDENCPSNDSDVHYTQSVLRDDECKDPGSGRQGSLTTLSIILILLSIVYLLLEISQMIRRQLKYFRSYENYIQILVFLFTITFVFGFPNDCWCAPPWQWQIGALAVFLAWFNVIILLKDMPWAGIPINMLFNIIKTFIKLIFMPVLLIIAFSIPFYMLFVRNLAGIKGEGPGILLAFSSPYRAVAKTTIQTAGEFDYETLFNEADLLYSPMAYVLFITFVVIMPILFSNLLIGLAVGNTQEEVEKATFTNIMLQVDYILELDGLYNWLHQLMKLPKLEFKERQYHWKIQQWWEKMWGIDFKTQKEVTTECQTACDDFVSCIKETGHEYLTEQEIARLNDKVSRMEEKILNLEKVQKQLKEILESSHEEASRNNQIVQESLKQLIGKL